MNNYELLYILPSSMTGAEIKKTFLEIEKEVEGFGGKKLSTLLNHPFLLKTEVSKEEAAELQDIPVIKKKLAYPIKKNRFGFYCLLNFSSEGKILQELDRYLRMNKDVLRHIIVQEDPMTEEELKQLQKLFARKKAEQDKEEITKLKEKEKETNKRKEKKIPNEIKKAESPKEKVKEIETPKEEPKEIEAGEEEKEIEAPKEIKKEITEPSKEKNAQKKDDKPKEVKKDTKVKKKKIKLEDLEEKLDEILEDTML